MAGFGDPGARLFILGLAPGYNGANRHGRVFTGDSSGRWLWGALHGLGVASLPDSLGPGDGMELRDVWISNAARCVPPGNRPTTEELATCRGFLARELAALPRITVVLALGKLAHDTYLKLQGERLARYPFGHGARHALPGEPSHLLDSYHPSRQNTNTGVLKWDSWVEVLSRSLELSRSDQRLRA